MPRAHHDPLSGRLRVVLREEREAVAPGRLRAVHRDIGFLEQRRAVVAVLRAQRDADGRRQPAFLAQERERLRQCVEESLGELAHVGFARDVLGEHDEFVAAEPRRGVGRANRVRDPLRHDLQHLVAGEMTEGIVDVLEPVEVDEQDGERLAVPSRHGQRVFEALEEGRAIVEEVSVS